MSSLLTPIARPTHRPTRHAFRRGRVRDRAGGRVPPEPPVAGRAGRRQPRRCRRSSARGCSCRAGHGRTSGARCSSVRPPSPSTSTRRASRRRSGATFLGLAGLAFLVGVTPLGWLLVAAVAGLQTLLAVTGICVGCRLYFLRWFVPSVFARLFRRTDALAPARGSGAQARRLAALRRAATPASSGSSSPWRYAMIAAWVPVGRAELQMMFWTCFLTVSSAIDSFPPISLFVSPSASNRRTEDSRGVSEKTRSRRATLSRPVGSGGALSASRSRSGPTASWPPADRRDHRQDLARRSPP